MKSLAKTLTLLALVVLVAAPLSAADEKKKKKGKRGSLAENTIKRYEKAELTDEQIAKIKALAAEVGPKLADLRGKAKLSKEQTTARREAMKKAKEDGKKGKEIRAAADAAASLTDEQKATMKEVAKINGEYNKSVMGLLTAEQKQKAGIKKRKKKKDA